MDSNKTKLRVDVSNVRLQHAVNKWGARFIPAILIGLVGYSVWVVVVLICVNYLLEPTSNTHRRTGAAVAIIVVYFALFSLMATSYIRVLQVVATEPGYVPLPNSTEKHPQKSSRSGATSSTEKDEDLPPSQNIGYLDRSSLSNGHTGPPPGMTRFYSRDIFECEIDGMPRWCSTCKNWKPDRTHHSSEIGRCVYKMDHFCPWAGGIVSETSFKFFVQFLIYGTFWNLFVLVVSAYYTAKGHSDTNLYNINWIVATTLSGLFFMFAAGMTNTSLLAIIKNSTTVDNLAYRTRIHHFAVLIPPPPTTIPLFGDSTFSAPPSSPSDRMPPPRSQTLSQALDSASPPQQIQHPPRMYPTITYPLPSPANPNPPNPRTFAVLSTPTGSNPYLLHSRLQNIKTVMGERVWDWFLPFRFSPCYDHGHKRWFGDSGDRGAESGVVGRKYMYELGPVVEEMVKGAGLRFPGT